MNADGSAPEQLTRDDANNTHPYPSPDGRSVAFLTFGGAPGDRAPLRDARLRLLSLADGQYLAFVSYQRVAH